MNVIFPNTKHQSLSVCLKNYLGGEVFTIHDVTGGTFSLLELDDRFDGHHSDMRGNVITT